MSGGYLTIFTSDRARIIGELSDATWTEEPIEGGVNHILTGVASDGTYDEFLRLNSAGVDHVSFEFVSDEGAYLGDAVLLRPTNDGTPGGNLIRIEAVHEPTAKVSA
ncbi:MAG TPA: hypothetical protein VGE01_09850 [Fimbriimonas sp.]